MRRSHFAMAALLALAAQARAQGIADSDRSYLQDQAQGTDYELAAARLADDTSKRPDIRGYAQIVITDHEELDQTLAELARSKGVALPAAMKDSDQARLKRLQALKGRQFDQAYIEETTRINQDDEKQDQKEASETQDAAMQTFAKKMAETDDKHGKLGRSLDGQD